MKKNCSLTALMFISAMLSAWAAGNMSAFPQAGEFYGAAEINLLAER
jgi:hypothetical protein